MTLLLLFSWRGRENQGREVKKKLSRLGLTRPFLDFKGNNVTLMISKSALNLNALQALRRIGLLLLFLLKKIYF